MKLSILFRIIILQKDIFHIVKKDSTAGRTDIFNRVTCQEALIKYKRVMYSVTSVTELVKVHFLLFCSTQ